MTKVKLTQAQADAIERIKSEQLIHIKNIKNSSSLYRNTKDWEKPLFKLEAEEIQEALFEGYEVEPEFKVGDWVHVSWSNTKPSVHKVIKTGVRSTCGNKSGIEIDWDGSRTPPLDIIRHATPEEIATEKERRWWAKHNRDVWEIREDDILEYLNDLYIVDSFDSEKVYIKSGIERKTDCAEPFDFVKKHFKVVAFSDDRKDV